MFCETRQADIGPIHRYAFFYFLLFLWGTSRGVRHTRQITIIFECMMDNAGKAGTRFKAPLAGAGKFWFCYERTTRQLLHGWLKNLFLFIKFINTRLYLIIYAVMAGCECRSLW